MKQILISRRTFTEAKIVAFHKMCDASTGQEYFYKNRVQRRTHPTLSHLTIIILVGTFGIFLLGISLNLGLDVPLNVGGITVGGRGNNTFAIVLSLHLKQHFFISHNISSPKPPSISFTYNFSAGSLKSAKGLWQPMVFPPSSDKLPG
jgi:hypothetical protein